MSKVNAGILGTGHSYPKGILTNADLEKIVDTSDEWITTRTGIKQRRKAAPNEYTSQFAVRASREAIKRAGLAQSRGDGYRGRVLRFSVWLVAGGCDDSRRAIQVRAGDRSRDPNALCGLHGPFDLRLVRRWRRCCGPWPGGSQPRHSGGKNSFRRPLRRATVRARRRHERWLQRGNDRARRSLF